MMNALALHCFKLLKVASLFLVFALSACAGRVSGDLKDVPTDVYLKGCDQNHAFYALRYSSDAADDYGSQSFAGKISSTTWGVIPSYTNVLVHSQVEVFKDNKPFKTLKYESRVHKFFGLIWLLVLPSEGVNWLHADEGGGLRVRWGIHDRTISKAVKQLGLNPESNDVCESTERDQST